MNQSKTPAFAGALETRVGLELELVAHAERIAPVVRCCTSRIDAEDTVLEVQSVVAEREQQALFRLTSAGGWGSPAFGDVRERVDGGA